MNDSPAAVLADSLGHEVTVVEDSGNYAVNVTGSMREGPPPPPAGAVIKQISADTPLEISTDTDSEYVITNGKSFYLQQLVAGAVGDPTEKGSGIEIYYYDGAAAHLVQRVYISGFSQTFIYPNLGESRDGTAMAGDGSTKKIIVRRKRYSGSSQEVDAVVLGYEI